MKLQEIEAQISELEERVDRLRALYDQYFSGIEKLEPLILRKEVDRRLWALRKMQIRNTALRFKLQTVVQRYNTFQQHWARICRDIENGTYRRDVARAAARFGEAATQTALGRKRQAMFDKGQKKQAERDAARKEREEQGRGDEQREAHEQHEQVEPRSHSSEMGALPFASIQMPAVRPSQTNPTASGSSGTRPAVQPNPLNVPPSGSRVGPIGAGGIAGSRVHPFQRNPFAEPGAKPAEPPSRPGPRAVPKPGPAGADGELSDTRLRQIYSAYVDSRRERGESTASLTYENLAKTLRSTGQQIRSKHKAKTVDFEVVVRDGKTMLKPVLK